MKLRVQALGGLRHWLPEPLEETEHEVPDGMNVHDILKLIGIPRAEIMKVAIRDEVVAEEHVPSDGDVLELFPTLTGG